MGHHFSSFLENIPIKTTSHLLRNKQILPKLLDSKIYHERLVILLLYTGIQIYFHQTLPNVVNIESEFLERKYNWIFWVDSKGFLDESITRKYNFGSFY